MKQSTDARPERKRSPAKRPDVIVDFISGEGLLYIAVDNIGDEPALMVSVRFSPKLNQSKIKIGTPQ